MRPTTPTAQPLEAIMSDQQGGESLDPRTGRPFGDHGTAEQAIDFAISVADTEAEAFLRSWQQGDLDEWPEFYVWLAHQPQSPETPS